VSDATHQGRDSPRQGGFAYFWAFSARCRAVAKKKHVCVGTEAHLFHVRLHAFRLVISWRNACRATLVCTREVQKRRDTKGPESALFCPVSASGAKERPRFRPRQRRGQGDGFSLLDIHANEVPGLRILPKVKNSDLIKILLAGLGRPGTILCVLPENCRFACRGRGRGGDGRRLI
jgi:hypothetical protein